MKKIPNSGFVAGTLVHTQTGLVPIEQIKVGDYVLSKADNDGGQTYQCVTQTLELPPVRIIKQSYFFPDDVQYEPQFFVRTFSINTTLNQFFWEVGKRKSKWVAVKSLKGHGWLKNKLVICDGRQVESREWQNIYISDQQEVGWLPCSKGANRRPGHLWDFINDCLVASNVLAIQEVQDNDRTHFFKLPVYNLEVEDFHSYYVGTHGVLVHDGTEMA